MCKSKLVYILGGKGENIMVKEKEVSKYEYDQDASEETWNKCYKEIYKSSIWDFWGKFNFNKLKKTYTKVPRFYAQIIVNEEYPEFNKYSRFKISGDTDFNFGKNKKKGKQKYEGFKSLLEHDYQGNERQVHLNKLDECYERRYNLENFSFMPMTGGLQLIKGAYEYDRPDVLVYKLSEYYKTYEIDKLSNVKYRNREALETYLKLFDNIYDYCSKIYMINSKDKEFVDKIIEQGKEPINCGARVVEYMDIAEKFWNIKKEALNNA